MLTILRATPGHPADFEVRSRFLTAEQGGRITGPAWQHYRGDWAYADDATALYMIHPEFVSDDVSLYLDGNPVPWEGIATTAPPPSPQPSPAPAIR